MAIAEIFICCFAEDFQLLKQLLQIVTMFEMTFKNLLTSNIIEYKTS